MQYVPDYPILTERLSLRPFSRGDVDAVFAYRQRADVARYLFDEPMTRTGCSEAVQVRVGQRAFDAECCQIVLAVERRAPVAMIGEVLLILRDEAAGQGEIGYVFHPDHGRQGLATEAARAVLALGFAAGLHRIYARCASENAASWRLMERLGMRREGHFREHQIVKGQWADEFVYAILAPEWRVANGA